jgi:hypothetical protein
MDGPGLISKVQDLLAAERWTNEGGQVAPEAVLDRERADARRLLGSFSQRNCEKDSDEPDFEDAEHLYIDPYKESAK